MDDRELPAGRLQLEPHDGRHPGRGAAGAGSRLPCAADENENRPAGCGQGRGDGATGGPASEQDSLNNNAGCGAAAGEASEDTAREGPGHGGRDLRGKAGKAPGESSSGARTGAARGTPPGLSSGDAAPLVQEDEPGAATRAAGGAESAPALAWRSLFALIRGEVEQLDSRALPLCLHQIAESYFQEEDYEKAMKFIQLERLYHEQLLANLSAIQEQWETKWKTVQPRAVTSPRNSEKGFNGEDFEQLTKFCATHQDPLPSTSKTAAAEPAPGRERSAAAGRAGPRGSGAAAQAPESGRGPGMEPSGESQPREEESPGSRRAAPPRPPAASGQDRTSEPLGTPDHPAPELPAPQHPAPDHPAPEHPAPEHPAPQLPQAACTPGPLSARSPEEAPSSGAVAAPPALAGSAHTPRAPEARSAPAPGKELQLPLAGAAEAWPADPPEPWDLKEPQQPDPAGRGGGSPWERAAPQRPARGPGESAQAAALGAGPPGGWRDPGPEAEDYLSRLLEGRLRGAEDALSCEEDPDLPDLSPDEASYSLQDDLPSDGSLSPDDLPKRIEIAEVVPAAGLVSILKKRSDAVGDPPAQMQQKPPKRRVRFQEIDDSLEQDEAGSGSCLLLVLLCIATVLLSVGGTALYCAFGDLESPVCTDFAHNVDFYYTKLLQAMAELKHWVPLS